MSDYFNDCQIVLASTSPRRKELLKLITDNFIAVNPGADEPVLTLSPEQTVMTLAKMKATSVAIEKTGKKALIIGADTLVFLNGKQMGKPKDEKEAYDMIKNLSGERSYVYTGVAVYIPSKNLLFTDYEKTSVIFDVISNQEIIDYISTGEPFDKAGGYAIQGYAAKFIKEIHGDYYNVVGLPVHLVYKMISEALNG